jgi:hypothetical protein
MRATTHPRLAHPSGEQPSVEVYSATADTFAGRIHVEWDAAAPVTPFGQLPFFIDYLKQAGLFDAWVTDAAGEQVPLRTQHLVQAGEEKAAKRTLGPIAAEAWGPPESMPAQAVVRLAPGRILLPAGSGRQGGRPSGRGRRQRSVRTRGHHAGRRRAACSRPGADRSADTGVPTRRPPPGRAGIPRCLVRSR